MRSFYIEKAQLADHSSWDPETKTAISHFATKASTYLQDNAHYDPSPTLDTRKRNATTSVIDLSNQVRTHLLNHLGHRIDETPLDVSSNISGVSPHTGDGNNSTASTVNSNNTSNKILKTKDFALQLAESRAKQADQAILLQQSQITQSQQESIITALQQQREELQHIINTAESQTQQGAPHLSGSGASSPADLGDGEAPQGT